MQSLRPDPRAAYRNVFHALLTIVRTEGIWRPVRGVNAMATGAGPAHALYFACYERIKTVLSEGRNSHLANGEHRTYCIIIPPSSTPLVTPKPLAIFK